MKSNKTTGDLLDQDLDVTVNAWNRNVIPWWLLLPQGVSGAIKGRAGYQPFVACALVFIGVSGAVLHRLIIGPGSLWRFYVSFAVAFSAYSPP